MHFKIKGVKIHISFLFAGLVFIILSYQNGILPVLILLSSLLHEAGHLLCMLSLRVKVDSIHFNLFGLRIVRAPRFFISPANEIKIALAGPAVNLILFLISMTNYLCTGNSVFLKLALLNVVIGAFNMLPVFSLDGGCALFSFIGRFKSSDTAEKIITITSVATVIPAVIFGTALLIRTRFNFTLLAAGIYLLTVLAFKKRNRIL